MKLCCIFNYAPKYRESIYRLIDNTFDTQFYFAEELEHGHQCDIKKIDYSVFRKQPRKIENHKFYKWRWIKGILKLPFMDYDAFIMTADYGLTSVPFVLLCKMLHKPVYAWGHGNKYWTWKSLFFDRLYVKLVTIYFTYGEGGRNRLIKLGKKANEIDVIYNSLCESVRVEERNKCKTDVIIKHFKNTYPTLLFVGRLTKVKKLSWLIKAIKKHDLNGVKYNLLLIGDGEEYDNLVNQTSESGLSDRIWFYGECYDDEKLNELIYNSDLCVSPGNVGLTALHSMMYGTPVLSHDDFETQMPEYETIIEGETGLLYKNGDFDDFCKKIENWISTSHDREKIRNNCYAMINGKWNARYQISLIKKYIQ